MDYGTIFDYNPSTGDLIWKERRRECFKDARGYAAHMRTAGKRTGFKTRSRRGWPVAVFVNCKKSGGTDRIAHRIIWKMHNGSIPDGMVIDHINGDPFDNRLENLRMCTQHGNMRNSRRHRINGYGVKGVSWDKKNRLWQTEIRTDQGRVFLGRHITKGMAAVAYAKAAIRYHGVYCQAVSKAAPLALSLNNSATRGPSDLPPR